MNENQVKFWRHEYNALKQELDYWRQRDNFVLFTLNNPPERDQERGYFLENMRRCVGEMQRLQNLITEAESKPADFSAGWEV